MGTCQWSGVEIITASTSARSSTSRKSLVTWHWNWSPSRFLTSDTARSRLRWSTSHKATTCASRFPRKACRLAMPCPPRPRQPTVIRSDGATDSPRPNARAGMIVGAAMAAAAVVRKLRRVRICLRDIVLAPGKDLWLVSSVTARSAKGSRATATASSLAWMLPVASFVWWDRAGGGNFFGSAVWGDQLRVAEFARIRGVAQGGVQPAEVARS